MVETDRLCILPLDHAQLQLYLEGKGKLEKKLGLSSNARAVSAVVKERVYRLILPKIKYMGPEQRLYHTFWVIIDKSTQTVVAELGFKGEPDQHGEIEIGYGTFENERNQGYMTEAVGAMIHWAGSRAGVRFVLAETEKQNRASIRVVEKNKFECYRQEGPMLWWKIAVK